MTWGLVPFIASLALCVCVCVTWGRRLPVKVLQVMFEKQEDFYASVAEFSTRGDRRHY